MCISGSHTFCHLRESTENQYLYHIRQPTLVSVFAFVLVIFLVFSKRLIKVPPMGSPIVDATRTLMIVIKEKSFAAASSTTLRAKRRLKKYKLATDERYTDSYVADIHSGVMACKYFVLLPFYWLVWIQIYDNMVAQAGMMKVGNTPNDLMLTLPRIIMLTFILLFDSKCSRKMYQYVRPH
jgi:POT family proton-dependent oligopeptide transporter